LASHSVRWGYVCGVAELLYCAGVKVCLPMTTRSDIPCPPGGLNAIMSFIMLEKGLFGDLKSYYWQNFSRNIWLCLKPTPSAQTRLQSGDVPEFRPDSSPWMKATRRSY
jgi:hypothetical protein